MTVTQMEYFIAAAQTLNFSTAADLVFTTRSALSRQISAMEEELGMQLFSRSNNVLNLTEMGRQFYVRIQRHYTDYLRIIGELNQLNAGMDGHISIGIMEDQLIDQVLGSTIEALLRDHPSIVIDIKRYDYADLVLEVSSGTIDLAQAFLYEEVTIPECETLSLGATHHCLAVPAALRDPLPESISVKDIPALIGNLPIITLSVDTYPMFAQPSMRNRIRETPGRLLTNTRSVSSTYSIPLYITTGIGVAFTNDRNSFRTDPNIRLIPISDPGVPPFESGLFWSTKNSNPLLHRVLSSMRERLRETQETP